MTPKKPVAPEKKLTEAQFKEVVRRMARKAIKEHAVAKQRKLVEARKRAAVAKPAAPQKITQNQLREMVRDSILECLEEELTKRTRRSTPKK